jgi:hypothetical protein
MSTLYAELCASAHTAYAQLLDAALAADHARSVADLSGSFSRKVVKGRTYWYYQVTQPSGQLTQHYVGPDSDAVRALVDRAARRGVVDALGPLANAARALGCTPMPPLHARVLQRLGEYGFFRAGGVLVGTHAFLSYGNVLGVRWGRADRTQDCDFAHAGQALALGLPSSLVVETTDAIRSLDLGLLPLGAVAKNGATFLNPREPDFRLDFLTVRHRGGTDPYFHPQLNIALQPLPFLEFSLEQVEQAVVFSGDRVVVVNVPAPARCAVHKLIVAGERTGAWRAKAAKDLAQAAALISRLVAEHPSELAAAVGDLRGRGRGWTSRFSRGLDALAKSHPDLITQPGFADVFVPSACPAGGVRRARSAAGRTAGGGGAPKRRRVSPPR